MVSGLINIYPTKEFSLGELRDKVDLESPGVSPGLRKADSTSEKTVSAASAPRSCCKQLSARSHAADKELSSRIVKYSTVNRFVQNLPHWTRVGCRRIG